LDACFRATGLDGLTPAERRFSAEDSLPRPTSKPHPDVYRLAGERMQAAAGQALAVEDSVPGAQSAATPASRARHNLTFARPSERPGRRAALASAGVAWTGECWDQIADMLLRPPPT
jgi:hypothetical protein